MLVVGIFGTHGTNGVLAAAAFLGDVCAWNGSGAAGVSGEPGSPSPQLLAAGPCPLAGHTRRMADWFSWEMVSVFPRRQRGWPGVPCNPPPVPCFLGPLPLTWGAAGAADLILGFVVLLFPVPAGLVLRVVWGLLPGEMEVGGRIIQGSAGEGRGTRERAVQTPSSPPKPTATHLHGPLPHQSGLGCRQETAEAQDEWPPGQAAGGGSPWQAHGGQWASRPDGWRLGEEGGRPARPGQWWQQPPEPRAWDRARADVPPGAERPGLAWPPGLQRQAQEVGVEQAGLRGGDRELWEQRQLSQSGKRNRLGCPDAGREGAAGKAREGSRAGTGPPPFFGSLARRGGRQGQARWGRGSRASGQCSDGPLRAEQR